MRQLPRRVIELARAPVAALFVTTVLLILVEAVWHGSVIPYVNFQYLLLCAIVFGALALWLRRVGGDLAPVGEESAVARTDVDFGERFPTISRIPVVSWLVRQLYGAGWSYSIFLFLVLSACFAVRYYYATVGNINLDEGNGLYDANLIVHGEVPFLDFSTRAPGYIYTLALFVKVFGYDILTGRLLAIVSAVVICFFIFKIGRKLYNREVGLVAALIYCLSPFFIYQDVIGYLRTATMLWVPISVYCLILAIKGNRLRYYLLSGIFIGIAMLFYRGHAIYLMLCPVALFYIHPQQIRNLFKNTAVLVVGCCLPVVPVLVYFILQTDLEWMLFHYQVPFYITIASHTAVPGGEEVLYFVAKSRSVYCIFRHALYLGVPVLVYFSLLLKNLIKSRKVFLVAVAAMWAFIIYLAVYGKFTEWYGYGQPPMPAAYPLVFFCLLGSVSLLGFLFVVDRRFGSDAKPNLGFANVLLVAWFFCASALFVVAPDRTELGTLPATIMATVAIYALFRQRKTGVWRIVVGLFVVLLAASAAFAGFAYVNTPNPDFGIAMSTLKDAGAYIERNTSPDEEIFTCIPAFAVQANRRIVFDISHPLTYVAYGDHPWEGYDPYGTTPSTTEIAEYMKANKTRYVVWERRAGSIVGRHPELVSFILGNYHPVVAYHDLLETHILERNAEALSGD